jgi:hypothetical protein
MKLGKSKSNFKKSKYKKKSKYSQLLVAHVCNPSYSGGRDQEDQNWKPAGANCS